MEVEKQTKTAAPETTDRASTLKMFDFEALRKEKRQKRNEREALELAIGLLQSVVDGNCPDGVALVTDQRGRIKYGLAGNFKDNPVLAQGALTRLMQFVRSLIADRGR